MSVYFPWFLVVVLVKFTISMEYVKADIEFGCLVCTLSACKCITVCTLAFLLKEVHHIILNTILLKALLDIFSKQYGTD